jgi:catechol 2,3-dioxygenase-like lactoylglutathione lyase family enzyme
VRISATTLESFRLFMEPDQEWMTEDALIATIKGEFKPNAAIRLGRAFGRILEHPERFRVPLGYVYDEQGALEFQFSAADIDRCLALVDPRGVFEAKALKAYGDCDVVAKADHLLGAHLTEFKTSTSSFDADKYLASCQWRFMVDIFGPALVTYHVFELYDHGNSVVELKDIHTFNVFPYDGLHQDCCELVAAFRDYVTAKGLDGLLRQRQADAA